MTALQPMHKSMLGERDKFVPRPKPLCMDRISVTDVQRETFERIALAIFTDMTNAGCTFQQALATIYLSGIQHAVAAESVTQTAKDQS